MRTRLFALIVLLIFLGIPLFSYWYFYQKRVSGIVFRVPSGSPDFTVYLRGKFHFSFLPLADSVFEYRSTCHSSCIFSPIPPLTYDLLITSSGSVPKKDQIALSLGEERHYHLSFQKNLEFQKIGSLMRDDPVLEEGLVENANKNLSGSYRSVATLDTAKIYALKDDRGESIIGTLTSENFTPLYRLPFRPEKVFLDTSRRFFIIEKSEAEIFLFSLDGKKSVLFPYTSETLKIVDLQNDDTWKVSTEKGVYTYNGYMWEKNPRFSDYIDVDSVTRVGYLSPGIYKEKTLQNIQDEGPVMVILKRDALHTSTLEIPKAIYGFFTVNDVPVFLDEDLEIWKILY